MSASLDPELLEAFLPEWRQGCAALAALAAPDGVGPEGVAPEGVAPGSSFPSGPAAAGRVLDQLRGMAAAFGIASLLALLEEAPPLLEQPGLPGLPGLAAALAAQAEAIGAAGMDLPLSAPPTPEAAPEAGAGVGAGVGMGAGTGVGAHVCEAAPPRRVLVVDDSAMMRRLVRETLSGDPAFQVVGEAADGRAALEAIAALHPDLTMLDIEMPLLDGIGVLRAWALSGHGAVVVVSSAARPGSELALRARRLGAAAVVGKPSGAFSPDLRDRNGAAILRAARRAAGLPALSAGA
ncbi:response regulator [Roseomonas sp. GC11]|uniref:response regulator n=1 Tax=Roseomonas sp. GC11 TaxID=2950546 RepID=UPI00210DAE9D|nr:response regulator [Roseomonas sp. GC11]MCQ4162446.1 response regulator [Roseomonas sp. GC11]